MESTLEDPRTCYFSFLSASKLARSGPISDKVVGNLIFETFKSLCNVQIVFKIVFRICSECSDCSECVHILFRLCSNCFLIVSGSITESIFQSCSILRHIKNQGCKLLGGT